MRTAIVTGGSRGIGAGVVLAAIEAGYDVAFTYRSRKDAAEAVAERIKQAGGTALLDRPEQEREVQGVSC